MSNSLSLSLLILFFLFTITSSTKTLEFPIKFTSLTPTPHNNLRNLLDLDLNLNPNNQLTSIQIEIGSQKTKVNLSLSTLNSFLILSDEVFQSESSQSYQTERKLLALPAINANCKGILSQDIIVFNKGITLYSFPFVYLHKETLNYSFKGTLGFPYLKQKYNGIEHEEEYSFMSQLKKHQIITRDIFSIGYRNDLPMLIIGDYPQEYTLSKPKTCNLLEFGNDGDLNNLWECTLNSIYFDDNFLYKINKRVTFSIGGNIIVVSNDFFNLIMERYFDEDIKSKKCKRSYDLKYESLVCDPLYETEKIQVISLVLGKFNLKLQKSNIFKRYDLRASFSLVTHIYESEKEKWTLPFSLFKEYWFVFDKETKTLGFVNKKNKK